VFDRAIDVQIMRLRRKIEPDTARPRYIKTERGAGYRFDLAGPDHFLNRARSHDMPRRKDVQL